MEESVDKQKKNNHLNGLRTFAIPFSLEEIQGIISINTNNSIRLSKEEIINLAFSFHAKGNISGSIKYYQYFIDQGFNDHRVFSNYGLILRSLGKLKEAEELTRRAIELKPDFAEAHSNLGNILRDLGKLNDAEKSTRKAIQIKPDFANAYSNLGNILRELARFEDAEISANKAIALKPDSAQAHFVLGNIFKAIGNTVEAENLYRKVIKIKPDFAEAHFNLGNILVDLGKIEDAGNLFRKAIKIKPDFAEAYSNLGNILRDLGELEQAEISIRKAIELKPDYAKPYCNLGNIFLDLNKLEEAEISQRKAIEIKPDFAQAYSNLGIILRDLGKLEEAEISMTRAINLKPNLREAYFNLSYIQLLKGDYESGLINYEYRNKASNIHGSPNIQQYNNSKLSKRDNLLVISEQGLGDTLQQMRYIPYLRKIGLNISFCAQEKLHSLIKQSGIDPNPIAPDEVSKISEGQWIPMLSLLRYLKVNPNNPIISRPYIFPNAELIKKWKDLLKQKRKSIIGINWQGNPQSENGSQKGRSFPLETFSTIANNKNIKLVSLQKGFGSEQLEKCSFKNKFVMCQSEIDYTWDFLENAAIIAACDLIITSDTSIAHLAGGIGKPTWLLLKNVPEWRWGTNSDKSFWYPSMKLFRQSERYNWNEVMERVSIELQKEVGEGI